METSVSFVLALPVLEKIYDGKRNLAVKEAVV